MYHNPCAMGFYNPFTASPYVYAPADQPKTGPDAEVVVGLSTANGDACYQSQAQGGMACILKSSSVGKVYDVGNAAGYKRGALAGAVGGLILGAGAVWLMKRRR